MSPAQINSKIAAEKISVVRRMVAGIHKLPLESAEAFRTEAVTAAAGESYLRRALEALLDLGRHVLAKGFGRGAPEYGDVPRLLREEEVLSADLADRFKQMAGYRNRLVHMYDEVTEDELYAIFTQELDDVTEVMDALRSWMIAHPERVQGEL